MIVGEEKRGIKGKAAIIGKNNETKICKYKTRRTQRCYKFSSGKKSKVPAL